MTLSILRDQIDQINRELVMLLGKRLEIAKQIARLKKEHRCPILDPERESIIMDEIKRLARECQLSLPIVEEIFQIVLAYTRIEMGGIYRT
jgi:chorismate mutase